MGVYAETNFTIECETKKAAKEVIKILKKATKKANKENDLNTYGKELELSNDGITVYGFEDSNRYQNLEWRCEQIWEMIKDIPGVYRFDAPFLSEAEGMSFENELDLGNLLKRMKKAKKNNKK
jgi:hypothetical protein